MFLHSLAHGGGRMAPVANLFQRRNVRRRRRRGRSEHSFQQKLATKDRRCSRRVGRHRQNAPLAKQSGSIRISPQRSPEMSPVYVRDPVETSQPFVDKCIVRREKLLQRAVLMDVTLKELTGTGQDVQSMD